VLPLSPPVDAEQTVIAYLEPFLPGDVGIDVRGAAQHFVRVRRIGGVEMTPHHDRPVLDVIVYHDSDKERMQLALSLWTALRAAAGEPAGQGVLYYGSTTLGPRQMPDPADDVKTVCLFTVEMITRPG
jgi:hypothetical protein